MAQVEPRPVQPVPAVPSLTGLTVSRFRIGERLGGGGMGEVYRARDTKLGRTVALKRMAPALRDDPAARRRFLGEAVRTSRLNDPHIAALYDVLEQGRDILLVMEYIEGQTLRQRLRQPLTLEQFLEIAVQCAQALVAAHVHGIIHGDIKPENIMLTPSGQVKVLDLGLARHLPSSDRSSTMDRFTSLAGTPAYMAPELLREEIPDGRADLFSLGVVFYEALAGRNPFMAATFMETGERILHHDPQPLSSFNSHFPPALQDIVSRLLAKDRRQRFSSAAELVFALQALQGPSHTTSVRLTPGFSARPRRPIYVSLLALLALLALAAAMRPPPLSRWLRPAVLQPRSSVLIADFDNPGHEPVPEQALREALTISLQQSRYLNVFPRSRIYEALQRMQRREATRIDENLAREICRRENVPLLLAGSITRVDDSFQIGLRAVDPASDQVLFAEQARFVRQADTFAQMDALASRVRSHLGESLSGIRNSSRPLAQVTTQSMQALELYSQAVDAFARGRFEDAPPLLRAAITLDPSFAMAHLRLGEYYGWVVGKNAKTMDEMSRAYDLRQTVTERERLWIEADYYENHEDYESSAGSLRALVGLYPDDFDAHSQLGLEYLNLLQFPSAISEFRRALQLNPDSVLLYGRLVLTLSRNNQPRDAIRSAEEAKSRGLQSAYLHWGLGLAYLNLGDVAQARKEFLLLGQSSDADRELGPLYLAVADLFEGKLRNATLQLASQLSAPSGRGLYPLRAFLLGRTYLVLGDNQAAARQARSILALSDSDLQTNNIADAGLLYARSGNLELARAVLRRLDASRRQAPTAWNVCSYYSQKGEIALATGEPRQALGFFQLALARFPDPALHFVLARSWQQLHSPSNAAQEWELFLAAQGDVLQSGFPPDLVVAHFELARLYRQLGNQQQARAHYQAVLHLWAHADDLPMARLAARELPPLTAN
ncbi:MAG TPA: protein kinase [Terriglobales bacterium]|nr:protein kinase [Terriglobales bacterium]